MGRARRARGERGASLILALGFLALCGVLIPAIVNLAGTNLSDTSRLQQQRGGVYAADGAVDAAIQYLRQNDSCGTPFGSCPLPFATAPDRLFMAALNGTTANVTVITRGTFADLDRTVELKARLGSDPKVRTDAVVVIREGPGAAIGSQPVDVKSWVYNR
jgi:hypothetical protein